MSASAAWPKRISETPKTGTTSNAQDWELSSGLRSFPCSIVSATHHSYMLRRTGVFGVPPFIGFRISSGIALRAKLSKCLPAPTVAKIQARYFESFPKSTPNQSLLQGSARPSGRAWIET